jgi:hypothetical protein
MSMPLSRGLDSCLALIKLVWSKQRLTADGQRATANGYTPPPQNLSFRVAILFRHLVLVRGVVS